VIGSPGSIGARAVSGSVLSAVFGPEPGTDWSKLMAASVITPEPSVNRYVRSSAAFWGLTGPPVLDRAGGGRTGGLPVVPPTMAAQR
jgi:hypothetical protein